MLLPLVSVRLKAFESLRRVPLYPGLVLLEGLIFFLVLSEALLFFRMMFLTFFDFFCSGDSSMELLVNPRGGALKFVLPLLALKRDTTDLAPIPDIAEGEWSAFLDLFPLRSLKARWLFF